MCGNAFSSGKNISPHRRLRKRHIPRFRLRRKLTHFAALPLPTRNACGWFLAGALSGCAEMLFPPEKTFPPIRSVGEWGVQTLIGLSIGLYLVSSCYRSSDGESNPELWSLPIVIPRVTRSPVFQLLPKYARVAHHSEVRFVGLLLSLVFSFAVLERFSGFYMNL